MPKYEIEQIRLQIAAIILAGTAAVAWSGANNSGQEIQFLSVGLILSAIAFGLYIIYQGIAFSPLFDKPQLGKSRESLIISSHAVYNVSTIVTIFFLIIFLLNEVAKGLQLSIHESKDVAILLLIIALIVAILRPKINKPKKKNKRKTKSRKKIKPQ